MEEMLAALRQWQDSKTFVPETPTEQVWAGPSWFIDEETRRVRDLLLEHAISKGPKGYGVIPAAARAVKQVDCDLIVTRNNNGVLSIALVSSYGAIVLCWNADEVLAFHQRHQSIVQEAYGPATEPVGFKAKLADWLRALAYRVESW